jgi:hypothetical protein
MVTMTEPTSCNQQSLSVDDLATVMCRVLDTQKQNQQENLHLFELLIRQQTFIEELQSQVQGLRVENQRILSHVLR